MKWLQRLFDFYLNSSIHVSLAVVALTWLTGLSLDISLDKNLLFFTFFATITGYNFIKYSKLAKWHHLSLTESLRAIQVFSLLSFVAMLYFMVRVRLEVLLACGALGLITMLYALPVFSRKRNLRSLHGLKIYVIAVVWAGVTVVLPVLQEQLSLSWDVWVLFVQRFLFVLVITLPFDVRDLKYDDASIGTLPKQLGVRKSKFLGIALLVLMILLAYLRDELQMVNLMAIVCIAAVSGVMLLVASEKQPKYYASFFVEGLPMIWIGFWFLLDFLVP